MSSVAAAAKRRARVTGPTAPLAVSVGCPSGIGPEVAVRAAGASSVPLVLVGDTRQLRALATSLGVSLVKHRLLQPGPSLAARDRQPGRPTVASGAAQLAWVDAALDLVVAGHARGLVTGPVSKEMIAASGASTFRGHTEHLQARLAAPEVVMAFWSPRFTASLVTTHLALSAVPRAITSTAVASAIHWTADLLHRLAPGRVPRIAVAGLNPHAGEGGLLGTEERTRIVPGIEAARARLRKAGIDVAITGPMGAESAFRLAKARQFDAVVAMYHDQATIPMKLVGFGEAVNVSLGLPVVRTSVDHGTGYDRAGKGTADARGMSSAIVLADRLTRAPR